MLPRRGLILCAVLAGTVQILLPTLDRDSFMMGTLPLLTSLEEYRFAANQTGDLRGKRCIVTGANTGTVLFKFKLSFGAL